MHDSREICGINRKDIKCSRCNGNHLANNPRCPARDISCHYCNMTGHFARCCMSRRSGFQKMHKKDDYGNTNKNYQQNQKHQMKTQQKFVREVDDVTEKVEIRELFHLDGKRSVALDVGGVEVNFIIDTGADEDVLSIDDWKKLKQTGFKMFDVRKGSDKIFRAYGSYKPLTVLGEVDVEVRHKNQCHRTTLFVIQDGKCSLLSGKSAEVLGIVKFFTQTPFPAIRGNEI